MPHLRRGFHIDSRPNRTGPTMDPAPELPRSERRAHALPALPAHPALPALMIRLLAIDIDGTLLDSRGRLPQAHREALVDASARGIDVALVTGRGFHFAA